MEDILKYVSGRTIIVHTIIVHTIRVHTIFTYATEHNTQSNQVLFLFMHRIISLCVKEVFTNFSKKLGATSNFYAPRT